MTLTIDSLELVGLSWTHCSNLGFFSGCGDYSIREKFRFRKMNPSLVFIIIRTFHPCIWWFPMNSIIWYKCIKLFKSIDLLTVMSSYSMFYNNSYIRYQDDIFRGLLLYAPLHYKTRLPNFLMALLTFKTSLPTLFSDTESFFRAKFPPCC